MPIGLTAGLTRAVLDQQAGVIAQRLNAVMAMAEEWQFFMAGAQDADLEALGYAPDEIALLKTCAGEMDQLRRVYEGAEALPDAKDFRAFLRRTWGTGFGASAASPF